MLVDGGANFHYFGDNHLFYVIFVRPTYYHVYGEYTFLWRIHLFILWCEFGNFNVTGFPVTPIIGYILLEPHRPHKHPIPKRFQIV